MLIGGEWIADSEEAIVSVNPANGQVNYEICAATPRHVDAVSYTHLTLPTNREV